MNADLEKTIARVEEDERGLQFSTFSDEEAFTLGTQMRALAVARGLGIAIDIARGEQQLRRGPAFPHSRSALHA